MTYRVTAAVVVAIVALSITHNATHAALVASYQFETGAEFVNSAGATTYSPDIVAPTGIGNTTPTHLATGGAKGSAAYQFNGTTDFLDFASNGANPDGDTYVGLTPAGAVVPTWTIHFWVKTTDNGSHDLPFPAGYSGTTQVPVFGNTNGNQSVGVEGGVATVKNAFTGTSPNGNVNIADGSGHYVAIVSNSSVMDIYVDGLLDVGALTTPSGNIQWAITHFGRSYPDYRGSGVPWVMDDVRIYDTALSSSEILALAPEPATASVLALGAAAIMMKRRRHSA